MASVNNIERLRKSRDWSRPDLAKRMGTTPQQVERLEKGQRSLRQMWIDRAADAFGVPPSAIISAEGSEAPKVEGRSVTTTPETELAEIVALDLTFSMGPGTNIDDYIEETRIGFDLAYIRSFTRTNTDRLRIARGVGDSMLPTLQTSDQVWIDTTQTMLNQQDRIWAISLFGAAAIKRLRAVGKRRVLVISDNPDVPDQEVDASDIRIGGRVIRFERDV